MSNDPKKFKIPKEFTLFGHRYIVIIRDDLFEKEVCYGTADEDEKKICLQRVGTVDAEIKNEDGTTSKKHIEITNEILIETFYHELTHIILDAIGEDELSQKESFVNMIGKAMLEVYLSSNYEEEKTG